MKYQLYVFLFLLLLSGCSTQHTQKENASSEPMALGWLTRNDFMNPTYPKFQENYDSATINPNFVEMMKALQPDVDIVVVLGTWCGDSKRQVPRFLKIADMATLPLDNIKFYGVDRSKKSRAGVAEQYQIELVPTFIFFSQGKEIGRIVESPKTTLEEEMLVILAGASKR